MISQLYKDCLLITMDIEQLFFEAECKKVQIFQNSRGGGGIYLIYEGIKNRIIDITNALDIYSSDNANIHPNDNASTQNENEKIARCKDFTLKNIETIKNRMEHDEAITNLLKQNPAYTVSIYEFIRLYERIQDFTAV